MAKKPILHPHSDLQSFQRLMLLILTIINHPNLGTEEDSNTNVIHQLQQKIISTAQQYHIDIPTPAIATLRKDLETLREYNILERRMYRWGYYFGTGVMTKSEFKTAFDALESMANYQKDATAKKNLSTIRKKN